ncbi:MAG: hypothetical protein Q4D29_03720, partial [Lachnospiraceae bacterium]|nr:hypothetical protein [Lachnospiraceae bacterium]
MKRRILCASLAVMMTVSLMACGTAQNAATTGNTENKAAETVDAGNKEATTAITEDAVITIWSPSDKESIENWW